MHTIYNYTTYTHTRTQSTEGEVTKIKSFRETVKNSFRYLRRFESNITQTDCFSEKMEQDQTEKLQKDVTCFYGYGYKVVWLL